MQILHFYDDTNTLKLRIDSPDDLYVIQRALNSGDSVEGKSYRRFKSTEGDIGSQKEIEVRISIEKAELDKVSGKLRLTGKILWGRPERYISIASYHTLNIGVGDEVRITKPEWKGYIIKMFKEAEKESRKPRLGIIAMDDEKATVSQAKGYGIEIIAEIRSHLSKRMKMREYEEEKQKYFNEIIKMIGSISASTVIVAGPGFMKNDLEKYIKEKGIKIGKNIVYASASDAERSGIREVMQSPEAMRLLEAEHIKKEFELLNKFMSGLRLNASFSKEEKIKDSIESYEAGAIIVNDDMLNDAKAKELLDLAESHNISIYIFNSDDDAGMQLKGFGGIGSISKRLLAS
ncbi:MAG: hypothetical protein ACP5MK_00245 [Candidatus Micrarchaeia archaeon]